MSEFLQFIKLLQRNRVTLILVPLITIIASYFLVKRLPDTYESHARIATGLVDKTDQVITKAKDEQDSQISRKFENLIQVLLLNKTLDQVSYRLILNQLKGKKDSTWREPNKQLLNMNVAEKSKAISLITKKYQQKEELFLWIPYQRQLSELISDMHYDADALREKLIVYRTGSSDYINLEFEGEDPLFAAYVLNTLSQEFIAQNSFRVVDNNRKTIDFLQSFMYQKQNALKGRMNDLRNYKIRNRVLNLNEQAKSIYGQMADFETKREQSQQEIVSISAAIKNIDDKFNPADRKYFESALTDINQKIIAEKQNLKAINEKYILSNFDSRMKVSLDSVKTLLLKQVDLGSDKYIYNPMILKQDLIARKLALEISLELSKNSVNSIQGELDRLNKKFDGLVPNEATIQEFETSIDMASKEYIESLQRYNEASLEFSFPVYLKLIERAMPGEIQSSKKMVLVILSGLISLTFCIFVFFILFFLDKSIRYPLQLANAMDSPVLGYLNKLEKGSDLTFSSFQSFDSQSGKLYRNLVRSIRFELDNEFSDPKIIAVTSLSPGVGKTSFTLALAWAFSKINKTVLIIDGNFGEPYISELNPDATPVEGFISESNGMKSIPGKISIMGNSGGDVSLFELADEVVLRERLDQLKSEFEVILIETDSLTSMNKAKEWITFADRVVAVFSSGSTIKIGDQTKIQYLNNLHEKFSGWVLTNTEDINEQAGKLDKGIEV